MPDFLQNADSPVADIPLYEYVWNKTEASTGYFECLPQGNPSFAEAFQMLCQRPLDTFLHKYLLGKLEECDLRQTSRLVEDEPRARAIWQILLLEYLRLNPDAEKSYKEVLRRGASENNFQKLTPLPVLALSAEETGKAESLAVPFARNLAGLAKVPSGESFEDYPFWHRQKDGYDQEMAQALAILRKEYARLKNCPPEKMEAAPDAKTVWQEAERQLEKAGLACFPEMRHEASLSPIALLRQWRVNCSSLGHGQPFRLKGISTAYGRGLSLAQARASLRMEIVERFAAFANIQQRDGKLLIADLQKPVDIIRECPANLHAHERILPCSSLLAQKYGKEPFFWFPGSDAKGRTILAPLQAVFLFSNLEEATIFENGGSSGLGAGASDAQARLAGLLECVERDAHAITPVDERYFFQIASRDPVIQGLLDDYRARRIWPLFQEITSELGVPAFRCIVMGIDGKMVMACAASLSGKKAALAALTETPWPYSWATPAPFGRPSLWPERSLPLRFLEDLPDYSLDTPQAELCLLENLLRHLNRTPVYCNIGRVLPNFPVYRVFLPGHESHAEFDAWNPPSPRLLARWARRA